MAYSGIYITVLFKKVYRFLFHDADYVRSQTPWGCLKSHLLHSLDIPTLQVFWSINFSACAHWLSPFLSYTRSSGKLYHCLSSDLHSLTCPIQSFSCLKIGHQDIERLPVTDWAPVPRGERPPAVRAPFPSSLLTDNPQQQPSNSCYTAGTK